MELEEKFSNLSKILPLKFYGFFKIGLMKKMSTFILELF